MWKHQDDRTHKKATEGRGFHRSGWLTAPWAALVWNARTRDQRMTGWPEGVNYRHQQWRESFRYRRKHEIQDAQRLDVPSRGRWGRKSQTSQARSQSPSSLTKFTAFQGGYEWEHITYELLKQKDLEAGQQEHRVYTSCVFVTTVYFILFFSCVPGLLSNPHLCIGKFFATCVCICLNFYLTFWFPCSADDKHDWSSSYCSYMWFAQSAESEKQQHVSECRIARG